MKKLTICLAILLSVVSTFSQKSLKYLPVAGSLSHEWLQDFIKNNSEGITVLKDCDVFISNDYGRSFLVLTKENRAIVLFNTSDSSFIIPAHNLPKLEPGDSYSLVYETFIHSSNNTVALTPKNFLLERKKL